MRLVQAQRALYLLLTSDARLMTMVTGVHDHVDQGRPYPYIVIGEDAAMEFDTDTERGVESLFTIHTWSRERGRLETKEIQEVIYEVLHRQDITIEDAAFWSIFWEMSDSFVEPDGETRHGVMRFRLRYDSLPVS